MIHEEQSVKLKKSLQNPDELIKKHFNSSEYCMASDTSDCRGGIVRAHTISKKYLKNISCGGKVFIPCGSSHHKDGYYSFQERTIKKSSTFTGFCEHHDNILFSSFENDREFQAQEEQVLKISFRSLCREFFQKKCLLNYLEDTKLHKDNECLSSYMKKARVENNDHKFLYEKLSSDACNSLALCVKTSFLPLAATGVMFPTVLPDGTPFQDENSFQYGFIYSVIPEKEYCWITLLAVQDFSNDIGNTFFTNIFRLQDEDLVDYLLTYFFFNNDIVTIEPQWWKKLNLEFKTKLENLMNQTVGEYLNTGRFYSLPFCNYIQSIKIFDKKYFCVSKA